MLEISSGIYIALREMTRQNLFQWLRERGIGQGWVTNDERNEDGRRDKGPRKEKENGERRSCNHPFFLRWLAPLLPSFLFNSNSYSLSLCVCVWPLSDPGTTVARSFQRNPVTHAKKQGCCWYWKEIRWIVTRQGKRWMIFGRFYNDNEILFCDPPDIGYLNCYQVAQRWR